MSALAPGIPDTHLNACDRRVPFAGGAAVDRDVLEQRLATAEINVALGFEVIAEQRQVLAALEAWGHYADDARRRLRLFEQMQAGFIEDLEAAAEQLAAEETRAAV